MTPQDLEELLQVGTKVKFGKKYAEQHYATEGEIITLVNGEFECENGLYSYIDTCPAIWNEYANEFDSIYHLFGNNFEYWLDNTIVE